MSARLDSRAVGVIICAVITTALAFFVVTLRFITRSRILNFLGKDDWCIGIALFFSMCNAVAMSLEAKYAMGQHWNGLSGTQRNDFLHGFYFSVLSYNISLTFTKISILLLYLRIFKTSRTRYGCYILLGIVIAYGTWLFFSSIFFCVPIAAFWDKNVSGHCLPDLTIWFLNASLNIATDIAIFILPLRVISTLSLPKRQKIGLYLVFVLGFFVCIISVIRLYALRIASTTSDPTWNNISTAYWSCIELNTAIICPSLATLKPLISRLFPKLLPSMATRNYQYFATGADVESNKFALDTIGGSRNRSESRGKTDSQSDTDLIYKDENFGLQEIEGRVVFPRLKDVDDGLHDVGFRGLPA